MFNDLGNFALSLAWLLSLLGLVFAVIAARTGKQSWLISAANATVAVTLSSLLALGSLAYLFLSNDYRNQYVWQFSNQAMAPWYKVSAIWGGMDGSMLLWATILSVSAGIVAGRVRTYPRTLIPSVIAVMNSSSLFFLTVVLYFTNPFRYIKNSLIPPDGNGLNPLLQNPYMAIHPPMLYLGFTTLSIPFAFCIGALLSRNLSNEWIRLTRRWTLIAWGFLTAGIALGGHWAYLELGWGGFWAWDPVENASFLPWLTASAFLHSVMVQERKNMLKIWNIWLVTLTYGLTVFGTFLTRSGVVQSVHAFANTDIGWVFLTYLGLIFLVTLVLTFMRRSELKSERKIESLLSREAAFLINNLIFLSICFATLWGVMFPVISEALTGEKQTTGIPFFNAVNVPLFLFLIFMMGVGPLIAWRKASWQSVKKTFLIPIAIAFVVALILIWAGIPGFYPVLSYSLCSFVLLTILGELHRGLRMQGAALTTGSVVAPENALRLIRRHRTRYGGYIIHFGTLIAVIGITASMAHKHTEEFTLSPGESIKIRRFEVTLNNVNSLTNENFESVIADVDLARATDKTVLAQLHPEIRYYLKNKETTTEVALNISPRDDFYLVLIGLDQAGAKASFKVFVNPLQIWLWVGVVVMLLGTVVVILPHSIAQRVAAAENIEGAKI